MNEYKKRKKMNKKDKMRSLDYSRTSRMWVVMLDLPPVHSERVLPQLLQTTFLLALPKMTCSFSQSLHFTRKNLLLGLLV